MLTKVLPLARLIRPVTCASSVPYRLQTVRHGGHAAPYDAERNLALENKATLDDLPVPSGSFEELNGRDNRKWNMQLLLSIVFLSACTYFLKTQGGFEPYYYWWKYSNKPPIKPIYDAKLKK